MTKSLQSYYDEAIAGLRIMLCATDDACDWLEREHDRAAPAHVVDALAGMLLPAERDEEQHEELAEALGLVLDAVNRMEARRDQQRAAEAN